MASQDPLRFEVQRLDETDAVEIRAPCEEALPIECNGLRTPTARFLAVSLGLPYPLLLLLGVLSGGAYVSSSWNWSLDSLPQVALALMEWPAPLPFLVVSSVLAGIFLWKGHPLAWEWAALLFLLQVLLIDVPKFGFEYGTGVRILLSPFRSDGFISIDVAANYAFLNSPNLAAPFALNLFALWAMSYLLWKRPGPGRTTILVLDQLPALIVGVVSALFVAALWPSSQSPAVLWPHDITGRPSMDGLDLGVMSAGFGGGLAAAGAWFGAVLFDRLSKTQLMLSMLGAALATWWFRHYLDYSLLAHGGELAESLDFYRYLDTVLSNWPLFETPGKTLRAGGLGYAIAGLQLVAAATFAWIAYAVLRRSTQQAVASAAVDGVPTVIK